MCVEAFFAIVKIGAIQMSAHLGMAKLTVADPAYKLLENSDELQCDFLPVSTCAWHCSKC